MKGEAANCTAKALTLLDGSLPKNPHVKIQQKGHGWIALSSLDAQPEPVNLSELKSEILKALADLSWLRLIMDVIRTWISHFSRS